MKGFSSKHLYRLWRQCWLSLHLYLGLSIGAIFVFIGLSGSVLVFWQEIDEILNPQSSFTQGRSSFGSNSLPINRLDRVARSVMPKGAVPPYAYTICRGRIKNFNRPILGRRCVRLDKYFGEILQVQDPTQGTAGDLFQQWQWPLHSGQILGFAGRILVFISGLVPTVLFLTGFIRWRQKNVVEKPMSCK